MYVLSELESLMKKSEPETRIEATVTIRLFTDPKGRLAGLVDLEQGELDPELVLRRSLATGYKYLARHIGSHPKPGLS